MNRNVQTDNNGTESEICMLDLLYTIVSNWRLLTLGSFLAGLLGLGIAFLIPPTFTAVTKFLPPQQQQSAAISMLQNLGGLAGAASGLKNPADQYIAFLKSHSVQSALVDRFQLSVRYESKINDDALTALAGNSRITSGKDGLITVEVDDKEPAFAAQLANAHVEELGKLLSRLAVTEAQQRRLFFEKQLLHTKVKLTAAEQALKESGVTESALKTNPAAAVASIAQIQAQMTAAEVKLTSMRGYLTESAPEFKQTQAELNALRAQSEKAGHSVPQATTGGTDYIARYRDMRYYETLFDLFSRQFELAKVDEAREGAIIQVLDSATPPERKSKPKKALVAILAAVVVGSTLTLFVFVRQYFRNQAKDPRFAQKMAHLRKAWRS